MRFLLCFTGNYHDLQDFSISAGLAEWDFLLFMLPCAVGFQTKKELKIVLTKRDRAQIEEHFFDWLSKCPKNKYISS